MTREGLSGVPVETIRNLIFWRKQKIKKRNNRTDWSCCQHRAQTLCPPFGCMHSAGSHQMRGAKDRRAADSPGPSPADWSQTACAWGICTPSYLSKIEQGKAEPSPEVTELLLRRLGLVWIPEPEDLKPCWNALLSGSPGFFLCYEQLVLPQQERLACSPLAADILLLAAFLHRYHAAPVGGMGAVSLHPAAGSAACSAGAVGRGRAAGSAAAAVLAPRESPSTQRGSIQPPSRCCETPTARRQTQVIPI